MSEVVVSKKSAKLAPSALQKTFDKLKKQIEQLQRELQLSHRELDDYLLFYHLELQPAEANLKIAYIELIKSLYARYYQSPKLSRKELAAIKTWIVEEVMQILCSSIVPNPELVSILKDFEGIDYQIVAAQQIHMLKQQISKEFQENGIDIDLSNVEFTDDECEMERRIGEAMQGARESAAHTQRIKSKTKKQLQNETKTQELEILQKKGLGVIYKKLAKILHPDLELNGGKKVEKEQFMKRLSCAYRNNDLHTLLSIEIEWMRLHDDSRECQQSDEQLKIYNTLLKKQVQRLKTDLMNVVFHHKYTAIQPYLMDSVDLSTLKIKHGYLKSQEKQIRLWVKQLQGKEFKENKRAIQAILEM